MSGQESRGSVGEYQADKQYPDMFNYVGLFSAAIWPNKNATSPIYQDTEKKLAVQFAKKPALYWIAIGKTDFLYKANTEFRNLLDSNKYPYEYYESEDGHIWKTGEFILQNLLQCYLNKHSNQTK